MSKKGFPLIKIGNEGEMEEEKMDKRFFMAFLIHFLWTIGLFQDDFSVVVSIWKLWDLFLI
jgi:hypothetical protein